MPIVDHPGCPEWFQTMPGMIQDRKNHQKRVYNNRTTLLGIFRSWVDLKSVMSTFSEGRKIYFETIFFIQDFFSETSSISTFECAADHQNRFTESIQAPFRVRRPNISLAKLSWFRDPGFSRIFWIWLWNHGFLVSNLTFSNLSNFASFQPICDWLEVLKPRDFSFFLRSHSATITLQFGVSVAIE